MAFIGLGANLGEPRSLVEQAFSELGALEQTRLVRTSSLYRSEPVGHLTQPPFVNAVAELESGLRARHLLAELHAIEARQ